MIMGLSFRIAGMAVVFGAILFVSAGTIAWPAGWAFLVLFFCFVIALSAWLLRFDPGLLEERMTGIGKSDQKTWDKVLLGIMAVAFFGWLAVMGLDVVRFRWSDMSWRVQLLGAVLLLASFYVFFVTFRENTYLSPAVRVQTERSQRVVTTGPYRYVRHPMYAGFVLFAFATALLLGSWYGLLGAVLLTGLVAQRAVLEERVLQNELQGYDAYAARVKYRLVPYLW